MLLSGDESLVPWLHQNLSEKEVLQIEKIRQETQAHFADSVGYLVNQARLRKVDELLSQVMGSSREAPKTLSTFLGNLSIHPFWGIPILLFVLWITYEFVGVFGAQVSVKFLEETLFREMAPPARDPSHSALHPHPAPSGIPHRPLWCLYHGPHLRHCHRLAHCGLFLSHLWTDGGFRISAQAGRDEQSDLQKDGAEWKGGPAHGPGTWMRYHGHHDHPDSGHGERQNHRHPASWLSGFPALPNWELSSECLQGFLQSTC